MQFAAKSMVVRCPAVRGALALLVACIALHLQAAGASECEAGGVPSESDAVPTAPGAFAAGLEVVYEEQDFRRFQSGQRTVFSGAYII